MGFAMQRLTITELRQRLLQVADGVLENGIPAVIEHRGKTLLLVAEIAEKPRLAALKRRKLIKGTAEHLIETKVGKWREPKITGLSR